MKRKRDWNHKNKQEEMIQKRSRIKGKTQGNAIKVHRKVMKERRVMLSMSFLIEISASSFRDAMSWRTFWGKQVNDDHHHFMERNPTEGVLQLQHKPHAKGYDSSSHVWVDWFMRERGWDVSSWLLHHHNSSSRLYNSGNVFVKNSWQNKKEHIINDWNAIFIR